MGFSVLSVGSPSTEKDGFSLFANTSDWQLGRQTNIKIQRESKSYWQTDACNPHREVLGSFCTCTDWQIGRQDGDEGRHMHITHMKIRLCNSALARTHACIPHSHATAPRACLQSCGRVPRVSFSTSCYWMRHLFWLALSFIFTRCPTWAKGPPFSSDKQSDGKRTDWRMEPEPAWK